MASPIGPTGYSIFQDMLAIAAGKGEPPWEQTIMRTETTLITLIAANPGNTNKPHWHDDFDEFWYIVQGELEWRISEPDRSGMMVIPASTGHGIMVPRGKRHEIRTIGTGMSLRLAVGSPTSHHIYEDGQEKWWTENSMLSIGVQGNEQS